MEQIAEQAPANRCLGCALALPAGPRWCGACTLNPPPLEACRCAVDYRFPWSPAIQRFKNGGGFHLATAWAAVLRAQPAVSLQLEAADALVPIPTDPERLARRGFDPVSLLARGLAPPGLPIQRVLARRRGLPAQTGLSRQERLRNAAGAYVLHPGIPLAGQRLVLVDDVMTTGATLFAAARRLREGGAQSVSALVLARTPAPDTPA